MVRFRIISTFVLTLTIAAAGCAQSDAQSSEQAEAETEAEAQTETQTAAAQAESSYQAEFLGQLEQRQAKFIALAEAFPQEDYSWRPEEGVRSVAEAFLHTASGNYMFMSFAGVQPPADYEAEGFGHSTTDKQQIIEELERSFAHTRAALASAPDDPERTVSWFGGSELTHRALLLYMNGFLGEHLGQAIAYARMNGVTPPWSEGE